MNSVLLTAFSLSVSGSLLAALLFALRPLLGGRVSARWQYYIWLVVVLRLLLPFGLPGSPVERLFARAQDAAAPMTEPVFQPPVIYENNSTNYPQAEKVAPAEAAAQSSEPATPSANTEASALPAGSAWRMLLDALWVFWLVGTFTLLVRKVTGYRAFLGYIQAGCRPVEDGPVTDAYRALCAEMGVRRPPALRRNPLAAAPMLVGVFRPFVVLPELEDEGENAANVLRHELVHHRRGDIFYKWLAQLAACVHWFNPLVYRVLRALNRDCELSCDEAVIRSMDEEEKFLYGETLLTTIKPDPGYSNAIVSITLNEDTKRLKERLDAIMTYRVKSRLTTLASALLAAVLVIGGAWTGVYAATGSEKQQSKDKETAIPGPAASLVDTASEQVVVPVEGDAAVEAYLDASPAWQFFQATGTGSSNLWPHAIAAQYANETAYPSTTHFFNENAVEALLTVRHEGGGLGIVIRDEAGDMAFSQANLGSGQHTVHLYASNSKYSFEVYMDGFTGAVLLEATLVADVEPEPVEWSSSNVPESPTVKTSPPNVPESSPENYPSESSDNLAHFAIPYYLDQFPELWNRTHGTAIGGDVSQYLLAHSVEGYTEGAATVFRLYEPMSMVLTAHTTGGRLGMRIIDPDNEVIFDQTQIVSARYRIDFQKLGVYNIEYTLDGYYGRMLMENEAYTDVFHGVDLGFVYGQGQMEESSWNWNGAAVEGKSTAADAAAYHVITYSGSWDLMQCFLPYMTWSGIDAVIDLYNQKNPDANLVSSEYYGFEIPDRDVSDQSAWDVAVLSGANWVYIEPFFPYMSNAGIDRVINHHNQLTGNRRNPADYYN